MFFLQHTHNILFVVNFLSFGDNQTNNQAIDAW